MEWRTDVELAPLLLDGVEHRLQLALRLNIERHEDRGLDFLGQGLDIGLCLVVQIGNGEIGTERAKGLGAAPGDRLIVGDAGNERLLALEQRQGGDIDHARFSLSSDAGCVRRTRSVWRAIISSSSVGMT